MTLCKLPACRSLTAPWFLHLDVFRDSLSPALLGRSRPDLVGLDATGRWHAFERKGRSDAPSFNDVQHEPKLGIEVMVARIHGIDFSGNERMWRPGCRRSNVWIATAELRADLLELMALRPVQELPGKSPPFDRLVALLAGDNYHAAAIDAPFALPSRHMPAGRFPILLRDIAQFETGLRPFAKGEVLVEYGKLDRFS